MAETTPKVTQEVFDQYRSIQMSGACNMVNKSCVQRVASEMGHHELVVFIEDGDYSDILMNYGEYKERFE